MHGNAVNLFRKTLTTIMGHTAAKVKPQKWRKGIEMKKFISILLVLSMVFGMSTSVFAGEAVDVNHSPELNVEMVNDHTMRFNENGVVETVEVKGNQVIYNNQTTGEKFVLTVEGNRIHSSATGETIVVTAEEAEELVSIMSSAEHPKTDTKKFSYAKIKSVLGGTASVATIAAALVGLIAATGVSVPGALNLVIELIGGISGLAAAVNKGSSEHGIKVNLKEKQRRAVRQGKEYYIWVWTITSISTY